MGRDRVLARSVGTATMVVGLGPAAGDDRAERLSAIVKDVSCGVRSLAFCHQVHGALVHTLDGVGEGVAMVGDGDALVTTTPGRGVLVWTADCVPVLVAGDGVVGVIHAGWRGCAADVVGAAVGEIKRRCLQGPDRLRAVLGPAVCGGCYEVGPEVPEALRALVPDPTRWLDDDRVDLRGFLAARLTALGVPAEGIETIGRCTFESPELASYRRDGAAAGRQWSMAVIDGC